MAERKKWKEKVLWLLRQQASVSLILEESQRQRDDVERRQKEMVAILKDEGFQRFPLHSQYLLKVLKGLETRGNGVCVDELAEFLSRELQRSESGEWGWQQYGFPGKDIFGAIRVNIAADGMRTAGLLPWGAGLKLCELIVQMPDVFKGRNVLELGSGVGLTGLFLTNLAKQTMLTDINDDILENMVVNVVANDLNRVKVRKLDWRKPVLFEESWDLVLAADCIYDPRDIPALVDLLMMLLHQNNGAEIWFLFSERNDNTSIQFLDEVNAKPDVSVVEWSQALPKDIGLFHKGKSAVTFERHEGKLRLVCVRRCVFPERDARIFSVGCFTKHFMAKNLPVIIRNVSLNADDSLLDRLQNFVAPVVGNSCHTCNQVGKERIEMQVEAFLNCMRNHGGETSGYLKDFHLAQHGEFYSVPNFFRNDWLNEGSDLVNGSDFKFMYLGPKGSKTELHHDVFKSFSWSVNVFGKKLWKIHLKDVVEVFQDVNEAIFIPSGIFHEVENLEETMSINHNWFNEHNAVLVEEFLKEQEKEVEEALKDNRELVEEKEWRGIVQKVLKLNAGMNIEQLQHLFNKKQSCMYLFERQSSSAPGFSE